MASKNVITYLLEMEDRISAELKKTAKRADELDKELGQLKKQLKSTTKEQKKSGDASVIQAQGMRAAKMGAAALAAALAATGAAYMKMGKEAIGTSAMLEGFEVRLGGLLGGLDLGKKRVAELFAISAKTPFQIEGLVEAEATLEAFGVNAPRVRQGVMDLAGAMGMDLVEAARAVGKGLSAGAGAADLLREKGVLSMVEMQAGMAASTMTADQFREALMNTLDTNEKLAGGTERLAMTFNGLMSTLADQFTIFSKMVGDSQLFEAAKLVLSDILKVLGKNKDKTKELAGVVGGQLTEALLSIAEHFGFIIGLAARFARLFNTFAIMGQGFSIIMSNLSEVWQRYTIVVGKAGIAIKQALGLDTKEREAAVSQAERALEGHKFIYRQMLKENQALQDQREHLGELVDGFEGTGLAVDAIRSKLERLKDTEVEVTIDQRDADAIMTVAGIDKNAAAKSAKAFKEVEKAAKKAAKEAEKAAKETAAAVAKATAKTARTIQGFNSEVWGLRGAFESTAKSLEKPKTGSEALTATLVDMSRQFLRAEETARSLGPAGQEAFAAVRKAMLSSMSQVAAEIQPTKDAERREDIGRGMESAASALETGGLSVLSMEGAGPIAGGISSAIGLGQKAAAAFEETVRKKAEARAEARENKLEAKREAALAKAEARGEELSEHDLELMGLGQEQIQKAGEVTKGDKKAARKDTDRGAEMGKMVKGAIKGVINGIKSLIVGLPDILSTLIPMLLVQLPTALITSMPEMIEKLIPVLLFQMPKQIILALVKMVPRLIKHLVVGMIEALWVGISKWWRNVWKAIKDFFTIGGKQTGGFIPKTDAYLLHQGERVVPASGAGTGTASRGLAAFAGAGTNLTINTNVVNPDAIPELSRLIDREMGANGRATVPLWGSTNPVRTL